MTDELPPGWAEAVLSDIFDNLDSQRVPINSAERAQRLTTDGDRYPYYGATGQVGEIDEFLFDGEAVLLGEDGAPFLDARKRKAYLVDGKYWVNNHAHILRAKSEMSNAFFCHQLNAINYRPHVAGTTRLKLTQAAMNEIKLVVAPAAEQQRIVSKIDELFSRIDEGERALERVQKLVERYRQSVLKAAVTGELTRDWREKNKDKLESGEALLARILKARREAWEKAELDKMKAKGITPANDKWKQKYEEPATAKIGVDSCCPATWAQPSLEQATRADRPIAYGVLQPGEDLPSGVLMIRVCDVADGVVDQSELKRIAPEISDQFPRTLLRGGEVLLTLVGTIGRTAVVPKELAGANVARAVGVLAPVPDVLSDWLELCLRSEKTRQALSDNAREVARKTLNLEQLREYAVPTPPAEEQQEAVSRVNELLSKANAAAEAVSRQISYANALRQATLKSAFSGRLLHQDANDEPASELLHRIAAERSQAPAKPRRGITRESGKA